MWCKFHTFNWFHIFLEMELWIKAGTIWGRGISAKHQKRMNPIKTEPMTQIGPYLRNRAKTFRADEFTSSSNSHLSLLIQCRLPMPKGTIIGLGHSSLKINSINMWNNPPISVWFRLSTITLLFPSVYIHTMYAQPSSRHGLCETSICGVSLLYDIYVIINPHPNICPTELLTTTVNRWWQYEQYLAEP